MTERAQRRGRAIAMTPAEVDEFLAASGPAGWRPPARTACRTWCRCGSSGTAPAVAELGGAQPAVDRPDARPRVAVVVDAGVAYTELRGVELSGEVVPVGDVPAHGHPDPVLAGRSGCSPISTPAGSAPADGRHAWLRLTPEKLVSWDFRKLAALSR